MAELLIECQQTPSAFNSQDFKLASATQYRFLSKDMNQNRWTCLTTLALTVFVAPVGNVSARNLPSPLTGSENNYVPISPHSLPTITPLVVTELETEVIVPATIQPVPQVSKLPIIALSNHKHHHSRSKRHKIKIARIQGKNSTSQSPVAKLPVFNPNFRATEPIISAFNPTDTFVATVSPVAPLLSPMPTAPKTKVFTPFTNPSATIATSVSIDRLQINSLPQIATIGSYPQDPSDTSPSFESGIPVFGVNQDQTSRIVNTVIAQVGDTIVAPEPSIAIPIEVPSPSTVPTKLPTVVPSVVKIEQPPATIQPTLDKIVATQTGQASWYGSEGGPKTANGERYIPSGLTAAHRTLPFGTKVRVTSLKTGKAVTVRINDRGPFHRRRIIDVSAGAAEVIGLKKDGVGDVKMEVLANEG